jgi:hypothetical protein
MLNSRVKVGTFKAMAMAVLGSSVWNLNENYLRYCHDVCPEGLTGTADKVGQDSRCLD